VKKRGHRDDNKLKEIKKIMKGNNDNGIRIKIAKSFFLKKS
jgi:hypothetical protein